MATESYTESQRTLVVTADVSSMASPGHHTFSFAVKTGKTQNKWGQLKSSKIGVWCEHFNVHQVLIHV